MKLEEVREQILEALVRERGSAKAARAAEDDREKVLDGASLADVASKRGIELSETRLFSAGETLDEIGEVEDFYRAALSLKPGQTGPIILTPEALYLMDVAERVEPTVPPLDEVKERIRETLVRRKARERAQKRGDELLAKLKAAPDLAAVAAANGLSVEDTGLFPRSQAEIPEIGFLPLPLGRLTVSERKPVVDTAYLQDDTVYVMVLRKTVAADTAKLSEAKEELARRLRNEKGATGVEPVDREPQGQGQDRGPSGVHLTRHPPAMQIFLLRHGETRWNREGRCQGSSDIELNETGHRQAGEVAAHLSRRRIDAVYSSDLAARPAHRRDHRRAP